MQSILRIVYIVGCLALVVWLLGVVFVAGLSLFDNPLNWRTHIGMGWSPFFPVMLLFIVALLARMPRSIVLLTLGLCLLFFAQVMLPNLRQTIPVVSALHPVNAFAMLTLTLVLARKSWAVIRESRPDSQPARISQGV